MAEITAGYLEGFYKREMKAGKRKEDWNRLL